MSKFEIDFKDVLLSDMEESRKLIVTKQNAKVQYTVTESLIKYLDIDILNKSKSITYNGTGYFVVPLDNLTKADIIQDKKNKALTIRISHAYLEAIEINPNDIMIGNTKRGLLAPGDIKLTMEDYNIIEKELSKRLNEKFNTIKNGQEADKLALDMVKKIYEPIVQAIDDRYSVTVEFK